MSTTLTNTLSLGRTIISGLIGVALIVGLPVNPAQAMSINELDKNLVKTVPATFGFMKAEFPADYDALLIALHEAEAEGADIRSTAAAVVTNWRSAQADTIVSAADSAHIELLAHYVDMLTTIRAVGGPAVCGDFVLYGSTNLSAADLNGPYLEPISYYMNSMMHAAVSARDTPERRKAASDADWNRVFDIMEERGGTAADLNALAAMDPSDPTYCDATVRFIDALLVDGDKAVSRVRAEYIQDLVKFS